MIRKAVSKLGLAATLCLSTSVMAQEPVDQSLPHTVQAPREFDIPGWHPALPVGRLRAALLFPKWKDADTGIESERLIDYRDPLWVENDPHAYRFTFCTQSSMNPHVQWASPDRLVMSTYGGPTKVRPGGSVDLSVGDSIMITEILLGGDGPLFDRDLDRALSFPPDPDNYWPNQGGLGTGMSFVKVPLTAGTWNYVGFLGVHQGNFDETGRDFITQTFSTDGNNWWMLKDGWENGDPWPPFTKNPQEAKPVIDYENGRSIRNSHEAMLYSDPNEGGDGYVYVFFGQSGPGITTFAARAKLYTSNFFAFRGLELWENTENTYTGEGDWIPFNGVLTETQMSNPGKHKWLWDSVSPYTITKIYNPDGTSDGLIYLYNSKKTFGLPGVAFRAAAEQKWPFRWGPSGHVNLSELWAAGYMPCTAGGISSDIVQVGGNLYIFTSTADQTCSNIDKISEGKPRDRGCTYQHGGLKLMQLHMTGPQDRTMGPLLPSFRED